MLLEEEHPVIPGIIIRAATLSELVDFLITSFFPVGGLRAERNVFPHVMLLMHQWFVTSETLAESMISSFWSIDPAEKCCSTCSHNLDRLSECIVYQYRAQVCQAFRYWMRHFPIHFDLDAVLRTKVQDFQKQLYDQSYRSLGELLDLSKLPSCDWARNISVRNPTAKHTRKVSLVFDHLEPVELADHITFLEHKVMRRITFTDFKTYAEYGTPQDNPKLERSICLFNGLSQWIQWMVLSKSLPQQRADVIVKFVHVAEKLLQKNNFNSLMSVVGGLSHSALARLSNTMTCVPQEVQKTLADLGELLSSASNFSNYRRALTEAKGFKIPILGVHMKDLISLHVALPDAINGGLINFRKIAQLSLIFQELWQLQNSVPKLTVNADLVNTLRLSLDTPYTEDELYELSLLKEPRLSLQSSAAKPTSFSEWAAGSDPEDKEVNEKFHNSVSDILMKNYDTDKDGYLSQEEFDNLCVNFPFFDAFSVVDADSDALINKADMKNYLLSVNSKPIRALFQHDFNETTYFKPTFCAHCAGLLWGLIKQGFKCRECGINAHKHCMDLVIMECRKPSVCTSRSNSIAAADGLKVKTRIQRPWRRQFKNSQSDSDPSFNPKSSTENEACNCDNGFVSVDDAASGYTQPGSSAKNSFELKEKKEYSSGHVAVGRKMSSSGGSSNNCCCKSECEMPLQSPHKQAVEASSQQSMLLQKVI